MTVASHGELVVRVDRLMTAAQKAGTYAGATCRVAVDGETVASCAVGVLAQVDDTGALVPVDEREAVTDDTVFDLASITKTYSAHTLLALVASGVLELDQPIADWLPAYREAVRQKVSLRHLLTHTSGLPSTWGGWRPALDSVLAARPQGAAPWRATPLSDRDTLVDDLLHEPLTAPPGERFEYACTGYNTAMVLAETATGRTWADLVREHTLDPLGLDETGFSPDLEVTAATEYQPTLGRGVVRGIVHDESAWSLGGACANAGLFSTSRGVLDWAETIRLGRSPITRTDLWEDQLPAMVDAPVAPAPNSYGQSLGLRIGQTTWMGAHGRSARGHNGFTGTSFQTDRATGVTVVLLTNHVHPRRTAEGLTILRADIAEAALAAAREAA